MSGVIAAGHPKTAEAGAAILKQGGNAVDAAAAAAFTSYVAESSLVNIGGGGIAQVYDPRGPEAVVYDFFSTMPGLGTNGKVSADHLDFRKIMIDFGAAQQPFYIGRGSVAVPGVVAGLCAMVEEMGTLPLPKILAPAIRLAREGVVLSDIHAYIAKLLEPILTDTPEIAKIYAPSGHIVRPGQKLYFKELAQTLEALAEQGAALFYTGSVAQKIVADQRAQGGLMTETDLAGYRVLRSKPVEVDYRGYTILLPPPASAGGVLIAFALELLSSFPLTQYRHNKVEHLMILAEVMRFTNLARAEWESEIVTSQSQANGLKDIAAFLAPKNIHRYRQKLHQALIDRQHIEEPALAKGPSNTTHISVADGNGMIVSITTSAGESAGYVVDDTGVILNNMLGEIDLHPRGFHLLLPGERLMTMMSPALVLHQGRPILAIGSGGSNRLRSAILQTLSNFLDFGLNLAEAVSASRLHFEENEMQLEAGIDPHTADQLEARGYRVNRWSVRNMFFGGAHTVAREIDHTTHHHPWMAVGDPRRGGSVAVVKL